MQPRASNSAARQRLRARIIVATRNTIANRGEQPRCPLEQGNRSLGVLHGRLSFGKLVALEHRQLSEVLGEIATRCRLELGDLLARVTGASQLWNVEVARTDRGSART